MTRRAPTREEEIEFALRFLVQKVERFQKARKRGAPRRAQQFEERVMECAVEYARWITYGEEER